ncbi:MAG: hypothetical protein ACJAZM_002888 [Cyclobacteriaceae bacterium]|jgi:hypothetical protein
MKRIIPFILVFLIAFPALPWGQTGHRVVGSIAQKHLTKKARKNLQKILGNESLAEISTYMDFIKSESSYRHMNPWHYCTIPDSSTYEEAGTPAEGDVIATLNRMVEELKTKDFTDEDELFALKILTHLVGDIHQPLHVGNGLDKGGNDVKLEYFWSSRNLHSIWDSGIIDGQSFSYSEYTDWINHPTEEQITTWQSASVLDWAYESKGHRAQVYDYPENGKLSYRYNYDNIAVVNERLLQSGIRLAGILNEIYG